MEGLRAERGRGGAVTAAGVALCEWCGGEIRSRRPGRFCCPAHRTAAWKARNGYRDPRQGAKASRNAKPAASRKPDLRISYRRAVGAVADALLAHDLVNPATATSARLAAESMLWPLLTDRQKAAL